MLLRKLNTFIVMCVLCVLSLRVVVQVRSPFWASSDCSIALEYHFVDLEACSKNSSKFFLFQSEWRFIKNYWSHVSSGSRSVASDLAERILRWHPM